MAKTDLEKIVLNSVNFNDGEKLTLESLTFTPAQAKAKLVENANADGVVLVEEPQYTPAFFELEVRVEPEATTDAALEVVGEVIDVLTKCARTEEGSVLDWTPNETESTYTSYAILGELLEVPITMTGEMAGWFVESPILKIKLTCRPFLYREERKVLNLVESSEQFQTAYIGGIEGDVPAEARMVITDKSTNARRYIEWGQDVVETEINPSIRIKGESFVTTNFSGTQTTKEGSVSTKVVSSSLVGSPVTICSTGSIANLGSYRAKLRVYGTGDGTQVRVTYKIGDGPETKRSWVTLPRINSWVELDLQELFLEEVQRGEQVSQIQIQAFSPVPSTIYIDTLSLMPTRRYAVGRGQINYTEASTISLFDKFNQGSGNLAGKVAEIGGTWAGEGDADDFTINTTGHYAQRIAVSDVSGTPRYALLGTGKYSDIVVKLNLGTNNTPWDEKLFMGILARYVDANNWAGLLIHREVSEVWPGINANRYYVLFYKKVAGVKSVIDAEITLGTTATGTSVNYNLLLILLSTGDWKIGTNNTVLRSGNDTVFSSSGALKEGKVGIFDEKTGATAETRTYDSLEAFVPLVSVVCNSGKAVEIDEQSADLESTNGKYWSPISEYRGSDFYLDPAGQDNLINRLAVKMRRNDIKTESDPNTTDKQALEVFARERFLAPR